MRAFEIWFAPYRTYNGLSVFALGVSFSLRNGTWMIHINGIVFRLSFGWVDREP